MAIEYNYTLTNKGRKVIAGELELDVDFAKKFHRQLLNAIADIDVNEGNSVKDIRESYDNNDDGSYEAPNRYFSLVSKRSPTALAEG